MQRHMSGGAGSAVGWGPVAVLVIDPDRRCLWGCDEAQRMLTAGGVFRLVGGRLHATDPHADIALRQAVARAGAGRRESAADAAGTTVGVRHRSDQAALTVRLVPLRGVLPGAKRVTGPAVIPHGQGPYPRSPASALAVLIHDPSRQAAVQADAFRADYGLTAAEARLASRLAAGRSLQECAAEFGVSVNTVRTHLKRLFDKTGTRRQTALVRLVLGGWPPENVRSSPK